MIMNRFRRKKFSQSFLRRRALRLLCSALIAALLFGSVGISAFADTKKQTKTNSIAIVFDNSYSM